MARGIGISLGISLMALALHLGGTDRGYAESTQGRSAFIVLAVVSAAAAAIALGRPRADARTGRTSRGGGPVRWLQLRAT